MNGPFTNHGHAVEFLRRRIQAARGEIPADLILKNGRVINVLSGEIVEADVAIYDGIIAGIGTYDGPNERDIKGLYVAPGFMDGHFHVESAMLSPPALAAAVLPHGTTAIVADPHELANVLGERGIRFILDASRDLPVDFYVMLPSCVPATHLETSGASLSAADLLAFKDEPRVLGLAEMMNYPGIIFTDNAVLEKIAAFCGKTRDGHAPLLSGRDLNAYIAAGLRSDHECTILEEAREKLRLGMHIMIREGTQAKNLTTLLPLVNSRTMPQCNFVTDDLHPHDIMRHGHLDTVLNLAMTHGLDPISAIAMVTINPARYFGFRDIGAIAPGYRADVALLSSLSPIRVEAVYKGGRSVCESGQVTVPMKNGLPYGDMAAMNVKPYSPEAFALTVKGRRARVIELIPDQIMTTQSIIEPLAHHDRVVQDISRDILKIAVIERHRGTGNIGVGLVRGFSLQKGAMASSVAHDSHNIICVGASDGDMYCAAKAVEAMAGGLAVACDGEILASVPLPIGGLMSDRSLEDMAHGWESIRYMAQQLGCRLNEPFMHLSFLALPVIPEIKITDLGLVDVGKFEIVQLFMDERD
ncbi:MAG: Adenine deaminase [Syntrophus sp. SKADARSKE-3]|nr:Adenine deaminase [Syntrophus sp. SKADARSKE-3]